MKLKNPKFDDLNGYIAQIGVTVKANEECLSMQKDLVDYLAKENYKMANIIAVMEEELKKRMPKKDYYDFESRLARLVVRFLKPPEEISKTTNNKKKKGG